MSLKTSLRTHSCGELSRKDTNKEVALCGWTHTRRDHGGVIFIDLRDRYGLTQVVFTPENKETFSHAEHLSREDVIKITGTVKLRPRNMKNPNLSTGEIEVHVKDLKVQNKSKTPPFEIDSDKEVSESVRSKYRYLDLRRQTQKNNILLRHKITRSIREYMDQNRFIDIETPFLTKSTPEGARDYLVPSRVHPGKFYALPQSPQIFKQILMASGFDRYYQIVRCFRDEDLRQDRQPEFTQLDIEMSFIEEEDIYKLLEGLMKKVMKDIHNIDVKTPFPRITYDEAMEKYGTDSPDLRFGLELIDIDKTAKKTSFEIFKQAESVKCTYLEKEISRKEIDELEDFIKQNKGEGLAYLKIKDKNLEGPLSKFFTPETKKELLHQTKAKQGIIFFIADRKNKVNDLLGRLRKELANKYSLIKKDEFNFLWVNNFPLFDYSEEEQRFVSVHHPFTSPNEEDVDKMTSDPKSVRSKGYDLVLNGTELGGGSIRIHKKSIQEKVFKALGISEENAKEKFGFLLEALDYGFPKHGGIALGLDRMVALLIGHTDIREVIAFPKNKAAQDLMSEAPSNVSNEQLKELKLKLDK
ncbi:MAG: aspartate--tRNA ligase [Candidatus Woesearchaeota archaeon]